MVAVASARSGSQASARQLTARAVGRMRLAASCAALTAVAFLQAPGQLVADTKVDLVLNPTGFLARATQLWNPDANFGELQNQAYGYLWPMGPFFAAGSFLGLPGWVIQRLWWALLLCVAFTGMVQLATKLRIGTPASRIVAGLAFALTPRILTQLGSVSVESWPMAVAPWVLAPLVALASGARLRRPIALSALAVACAGGVNATAVSAVVPLALLWLAMLRPLRRRFAALGAWCLAVACATAWWLVPLLVLGRYSPPFLNYIETSEVTTRLTDAVTDLRGASYWVAYLNGWFGPDMPTGWTLATNVVAVTGTIGVAAAGIAGLSRGGMPHRRFLVTGLLIGLALVGLGHVSELDTTVSGWLRTFLDGTGAPLRNVHKFDAILRIPLVLGLAHLLGVLARSGAVERYRTRPYRFTAQIGWAVSVAALAAAVTPALVTGLAPNGAYRQVPQYWHDAAAWFDGRLGPDRVLVVPGARFGNYTWGTTGDEVGQALLPGPWAVRNAIPLAAPTTIRLLDSVDRVLATGAGSAGLADVLARAGIKYVLARSDLDYGKAEATAPVVARQALQRSPGLTPVARFGPTVGEPEGSAFVDDALGGPVPALEVYEVNRPVSEVAAYDLAEVTRVVGGPESLLDLAAAGALSPAPTVLDGDPSATGIGQFAVLTDGLRRRDVAFSALRDNTSATMTAEDSFTSTKPAHDYLPTWAGDRLTTVRYEGLSSVVASSSWAQPGSADGARPEHQPYAALDGDRSTSWRTPPGSTPDGQWIELRLATPQTIKQVHLAFDLTADSVPTGVTVTAGSETGRATGLAAEMTISLPGERATRTVRIHVDDSLGIADRSGSIGILEITIPGLATGRSLVVPALTTSTQPPSVVLTAAAGTPTCFFADGLTRCSLASTRGTEDGPTLDRTVTLPTRASYAAQIWARPRPGDALEALLDQEFAGADRPTIVFSSRGVADPAARPGAVLDGDASTAWIPERTDTHPMVRLSWPAPREITGLRIALAAGVPATTPVAVRLVTDDLVLFRYLDGEGKIMFDSPLRTGSLSVFLLDEPTATSADPRTRTESTLPLAIGEINVLPGAAPIVDQLARVSLPCGSGPTLQAGSTTLRTRLVGTRRDLLQRQEMTTEVCEGTWLALPAGPVRIVAQPSDLATATRLALSPAGVNGGATASEVVGAEWSATARRLTLAAAATDRIVVVRENANDGWRATAGGRELRAVTVDGWQQGWVVPAGFSGEVLLEFTPQRTYQIALMAGAVLLLLVTVLAVRPARRRGAHVARVGFPGDGRVLPLVIGAASLVVIGGAAGGVVAFVGAVAAAYRRILNYPPGPSGDQARRISRRVQVWLPLAFVLVAGWITVRDGDHVAALPQAAVLLAMAMLWVSVVRRPAPAAAIEQRPLDQVPARGGEYQPTGQGDREGIDEITSELRPVPQQVDRLENWQVPEEQSIRDSAQPAGDGATQYPFGPVVGAEPRGDHQ